MNRDNLEAMQRADEAGVVHGILAGIVNELVLGTLNSLVAHYRGNSLQHDVLVGKVAEISALLNLLSGLEGTQRAGEAAREKEFGHGTKTAPTTPGTNSRPRSS